MRKWREKSNVLIDVIFKKIWHLDQNEKKTKTNKPMYIRTKKD